MKKSQITIGGKELPLYSCHTLIIGSGAAALNAANHLVNFRIEDLLIVTERLGGGTSNNSGSDKQTYYKLSLFGHGNDSVYEMAETLFSGGAIHGDIALIEAALSSQEFYHLVQIGVPFPHNQYGGYVGYKTDHDPRERATSAGPWTSQQMFQKLLVQVKNQQIPLLDQHEVISLLTEGEGQEKKVVGAIAIDKTKTATGLDSFVIFQAENIVLGTGGPGGIYWTSVYPADHLGSTGIALEAGARAVNLIEWQYGLSSIKYRWNVSGTYQQVIPRYISTEQDGSDEREFLNEYFSSMGKLATAIFLKGYQWPFDVRKINNFGSSLIDILVYQETVIKGRRVFMDFRKNPSAGDGLADLVFTELEPEAYQYLKNSKALFGSPIERLEQMNPMAIDLYLQHGIDLHTEPLEVAVCAQHNNGGLVGNIWWESNLSHLFPVGEANGTHGVYRPGGTALNSGQVGGLRAAEYIAHRYRNYSYNYEQFQAIVSDQIKNKMELAERVLTSKTGQEMSTIREEFQKRMTEVGAHIRNIFKIEQALQQAEAQYQRLARGEVLLKDKVELVQYFQNRQLALTQLAVLKSIEGYLLKGGGSRGSYLVLDEKGEQKLPILGDWNYKTEVKKLREFTLEYNYDGETGSVSWEPVRKIPDDNFWYEEVWKAFNKGEIY